MNRLMKRIFALILAMMMLSSMGALAEEDVDTSDWMVIRETQDGTIDDYDGNGESETLSFTMQVDEYGDGGFTIGVGDQTISVESCVTLSGHVYALKMCYGSYYNPTGFRGTLLMVDEYGPSDDPITYCFFYTDGTLYNVGTIPSLAEAMSINEDGLITTQVRANHLGTWSRPADYELAQGFDTDSDDLVYYYQMTEVPRDIYPMGTIVKLTEDLPLLASRYDTESTLMLAADQQAVLTATDDCRWLYVTGTSDDGTIGGWVKLGTTEDGYTDAVIIDGVATDVNSVFKGILYSD